MTPVGVRAVTLAMVLTLAVGSLVVAARAGGTLAAQVPDGVEIL